MSDFERSDRNRLRRIPDRGAYDAETIHTIIDDAWYCHVGFVQEGQPFVIPTIHGRKDDTIFIHGAKAARILKHMAAGFEICVTITHVDGLVLARSLFHSSMNYRSVVLFGRGRLVEDRQEKLDGLLVVSEHLMPRRWDDARPITDKELDATSLIAFDIEHATAKVRTGGPIDDDEDYDLPIWAGVLPIERHFTEPVPDEKMRMELDVPDYIREYVELRS